MTLVPVTVFNIYCLKKYGEKYRKGGKKKEKEEERVGRRKTKKEARRKKGIKTGRKRM